MLSSIIVYHFIFLFSLLTRFFLPLCLIFILLSLYAGTQSDFWFSLALIEEARFAFQRFGHPIDGYQQALVLISVTFAMIVLLIALLRAKAMTYLTARITFFESAIVFLVFCFITTLITINEARVGTDAAFRFEDSLKVGDVAVYGMGASDDAQAVAAEFNQRYQLFNSLLKIESPPTLYLRPALNNTMIHFVEPVEAGLIYAINFDAVANDQDRFWSEFSHDLLVKLSNGRVLNESQHWVLDAFGYYFIAQMADNNNQQRLDTQRLASLYQGELGFQNWNRLMQRYGYETAAAIAWSFLNYLEKTAGDQLVIETFFQQTLSQSAIIKPKQVIENATRLSFDNLFSQWLAELKTVEPYTLPSLSIDLRSQAIASNSVDVYVDIENTDVEQSVEFRIRYQQVEFYHQPGILPDTIKAQQQMGTIETTETNSIKIPGNFESGTKILWVFEIYVEAINQYLPYAGWQYKVL